MRVKISNLKKLLNFIAKESFSREQKEINIYFENNFEDWLCLMLGKFLVAKGIQDKTGGKVYALKQKKDPQYEDLCKGFHYKSCYFYERITWKDKIRAYIYALAFCVFSNSGDSILKIHCKGIHIGDLVYDYIIRVCKETIYTIEKIRTKEQFECLVEGFLYAIYYDAYFRHNKPDYFIAGDIIYLNGIIVRAARKYESKVIEFCTGKYIYEIKQNNIRDYEPNYHLCCVERIAEYRKTQLNEKWKEEIEKKIEALFSGVGDWNTKEAYLNKKTVTKEEILQDLKIENKKKNIVIMAHCFSDSPHCGGGFIYRDYYHWLSETLKMVKDLDNVNWILKAHPCRKYYGEEDVVEKMFCENKSENLFWMPDEYSSKMIPLFADAIITVGGTGGIEFACCGIPCVNVGNPFYSYYGFTIKVKSKEHYKNVLEKMHRVHRLSEQQINKAKEILYIYSQITGFSDDSLQELFNDLYYDYRIKKNAYESNNSTIDAFVEWGNKNSIVDSEIYKKGYDIGVP